MSKLVVLALAIGLFAVSVFAQKSYVTYHNYASTTPLTSLACSDGANGLITRFKQSTLAKWYPNVGAASFAGWNSPNCGGCYKLQNAANGKSVSITVVDKCAAAGGYDAHFDISPVAFATLGGSAGQAAGHVVVSYTKVSSNPC